MKTMAEVLTQHRDIAWNHETGRSICGGCDADLGPMNAYIEKQDEWLLTHQAAALAAAGYGPVKEAQAGALRDAAGERAERSETLLTTMQRMADSREYGPHDITRYGAYSAEAQTTAAWLRARATSIEAEP